MISRRHSSPALGILLLTVVMSVAAPRATTSIAQVAASSAVASVAVRLPAGKSVYHMGEEIPLALEFRGTGDTDYSFSTGVCGPFGRFFYETMAVTPADGADDPLADYFASGGFGGSCPTSAHALDDTPLVIPVAINEWIRFTRPGTYSVVVSSTRLRRYSGQATPVLVSAPITLTIVPADEQWAAAELDRAIALIDRADPADVRHGAAMLRYLGTEAAARVLVGRYDAVAKVGIGDVEAGLVASPYRSSIVRQMEARLDADAGFDPSFTSTLTRLRVLLEMPPTPGDANARRDRSQVVQVEYDARWQAAIARRPTNAASLAAEFARLGAGSSPALQEQIGRDINLHPDEAVEAFVALPSRARIDLLGTDPTWALLKGPWILPLLRQGFADWHGSPNQNSYPGEGDLLLRRIYDLSPEEGRQLILAEIRSGAHQIRYDALKILPDAELPELDDVLAARYATPPTSDVLNDHGTTAWLMARYGSVRLRPTVAAILTQPGPVCTVEAGLLAYLLKHDPAAAVVRLDPAFDRRARGGCVTPPLAELAARYWDDHLEAVAIAHLGAADTGAVATAASLLGGHGSALAKQPLLDRLARWSAAWRGRAADLVPSGPPTGPSEQMVENSISNALFQNPAFHLTKDEAAVIRSLCVTNGCRMNVDAMTHGVQ